MNKFSKGRCPYCSNIFTVKIEIFDRGENPQPQETEEQSDSPGKSPVQQLKDEIADCANELCSYDSSVDDPSELVKCVEQKLRQLSTNNAMNAISYLKDNYKQCEDASDLHNLITDAIRMSETTP